MPIWPPPTATSSIWTYPETQPSSSTLPKQLAISSKNVPGIILIGQLTGWGNNFAFMRYSNQWRTHRRMFHQYFQSCAVPAYYPVQMKATLGLLQQLLKSPDVFASHICHHAGSIIMKTIYGYDVDPNGDHFVELADQALEGIRVIGNVGSVLVDYFPVLKYFPRWMPGAKFISIARAWRKDVEEMIQEPFEYTTESLANSFAPSSLVSENLTKIGAPENRDSETHLDVVKYTAAVAFSGADSTVLVVLSAILAFLFYPEVQAKAQAELDAVVGHGIRLPNFDDRSRLPYIDAIVWEALRWNPVAPLGIAHRSVKEDVYRGCYIPEGTTIIGNGWSVTSPMDDLRQASDLMRDVGPCFMMKRTIQILWCSIPTDSFLKMGKKFNLNPQPYLVSEDVSCIGHHLDCRRIYGINVIVLQGGGF
ncbi:uncharacterized protein ARMOST_22317 [Armillaria ostoyae]|uniref:Cytochrome P450 CYP2 subfamily n=1 Tax=Armillaria ostoyae TaxID=47428 RepID=A0A284SCJ2_ARMOS|nr:uncharacterized protein ARMOST_22317 [Armillaria ostoyae]